MRAIADDRDIDAHILVDGRAVDIHMDLLRARRESVEPPGDAVVEARADADHHIAIMHGVVGLEGAVHAEHAEPLLVGGRIGAEPHEGRGDGVAGQAHDLAQALAGDGPRIDDAAAGIEDRALGRRHKLDGSRDGGLVAFDRRPVALVLGVRQPGIVAFSELNVLRDVDDDGPRPSRARDVERLVHDGRELVHVLDQIIVLRAGPRDADRVAFLERVVADEVSRHLSRDAHDRNGIHQRVGQAGDGIGRAGTRGHQHHADLAGGAGIAFGRMDGALLMTNQDVLDPVLLKQRIVNRQHGAARIAEDMLDALVGERFEDDLGACHCAGHVSTHWQNRALAAARGRCPVDRYKE